MPLRAGCAFFFSGGITIMIQTKTQGVVFGLLMSYSMAFGMEIYNVASKLGFTLQAGGFSNMTNMVFWEAFKEGLYMGLFVFLFSNLWGNKFGASWLQLPAIWLGTVFKNFPMAFFWNFFFAAPFSRRIFGMLF